MPNRLSSPKYWLLISALLGVAGLSACQTTSTDIFDRGIDTQETLERALKHAPIDTSPSSSAKTPYSASKTRSIPLSVNQDLQSGRGQFIQPGNTAQLNARQIAGSVELAFDNAPIKQVVDSVIGKILEANFVIDPSIEGTVTLRTARPVEKTDVPDLLAQALNLSGVSLIETSPGSYTIVPTNLAGRFASTPRLAGLGDGGSTVIMPLNYVSAAEMARVLASFTPQGARVLTDEVREALILSGEPSQINTLLETIEMFDVDWLAQMSFGVFELKYVSPADIIRELDKIFGGPEGPIGSQVEFVPMPRLSSVMVISKRPERLPQAESWIRRLDINIGGEGRRFQFLPVMNADAEAVAETLSDIFSDQNTGQSNRGASSTAFGDSSSSADIGQGSEGSGGLSGNSQGPRIRADAASNSLIVYATDDEVRQVQELLENIDVLPDQVLIEVVIAEVSLNDDLRYGVQWFFDTRTGGQFTFSDAGSGGVSARFPGFAYTFAGNYVQAALSALSAVTDIEVVSSPQIVTQDNQTATLQVGDQVPVVTQSAVSVDNPNAPIVNSIQYRDTGILLTVTPRINDGDVVVLEISQEVSDAVPTVTSGIDAPTIQQRQFDSVVNITDGETLALGGLIRASRSKGRSGIPLLKDVPLIGNAFSTRSDNRNRAELVVFLTPHIIRSQEDARRVSDHLRSKLTKLKTSGFIDEEPANR